MQKCRDIMSHKQLSNLPAELQAPFTVDSDINVALQHLSATLEQTTAATKGFRPKLAEALHGSVPMHRALEPVLRKLTAKPATFAGFRRLGLQLHPCKARLLRQSHLQAVHR